ncbi:hypothetical protein F511_05586 [Dorcoceras hygrometricum]|uniref:Uncharacterized protein n=1 Tax=Dorcoceras hygrometricum TaxID=472368 RepID=A0A2Z7AK97_9LAMI|nr:hypothetical protein F511_05586 [Dorcoceras hygrometricum]
MHFTTNVGGAGSVSIEVPSMPKLTEQSRDGKQVRVVRTTSASHHEIQGCIFLARGTPKDMMQLCERIHHGYGGLITRCDSHNCPKNVSRITRK